MELAPSLLSANFANLESDINRLEEAGINYLHLDVMDGLFVPNISYGPLIIEAIRPLTKMVFDVHLMIEQPQRYIEIFAEAGADIITFHQEATVHSHRVIQQIKDTGKKAGIALNPSTPICMIEHLLKDLDLVLIMSVNPGFGGQSYIDNVDVKMEKLHAIKTSQDYDFITAIDGGINTSNVTNVIELGADLVVSGSDLFGAESLEDRIEEYKRIFDDFR